MSVNRVPREGERKKETLKKARVGKHITEIVRILAAAEEHVSLPSDFRHRESEKIHDGGFPRAAIHLTRCIFACTHALCPRRVAPAEGDAQKERERERERQ